MFRVFNFWGNLESVLQGVCLFLAFVDLRLFVFNSGDRRTEGGKRLLLLVVFFGTKIVECFDR